LTDTNTPGPLHIGVTGHRFLAELPRLLASLERALDLLEDTFRGRDLVCLSSLAEGADRLVAEAVIDRPGGGLVAVLPFDQMEYEQDFETPESLAEFDRLLEHAREVVVMPEVTDRNEGYAKAGEYVLEHSDALITIWDGQGAQGQGGTGEIVAKALAAGKPVLHIKAGNRIPGTSTPTSLGPEQGALEIHNLPEG
jgi:hypothetical protein